MNLFNDNDGSSISFDPRLREYIEKKRYYAENDIEPVVPLESQYNISDVDRRIIRSYMKGDIKTYDRRVKRSSTMVDPSNQKFPSSEFEYDHRFDRLKKKLERERAAQGQRQNYGIMQQKYDMYDSDREYASPVGNDRNGYFDRRRSNDFPSDDRDYKDDLLMDSREFVDNPHLLKHPSRKNMYHHPPRIQYNVRQQLADSGYRRRGRGLDHDSNISNIIGNLDTYSKKVNRTYNYSSDMDLDSKVVTPYMNCKKYGGENSYTSVPYMTGGNIRDVDVESFIKSGIPSRGSRSLGYNNPAEHYFQYISDDIQDPDHVVMDRGVPTRLLNKQLARPKKRAIY
jgi:hypothetical protein